MSERWPVPSSASFGDLVRQWKCEREEKIVNDTCTICGVAFTEPSFGGPGICPACDCGYDNKEAQRKEIERLRLQLSRAREWIRHGVFCPLRDKSMERGPQWSPAKPETCTCGLTEFLKEVWEG